MYFIINYAGKLFKGTEIKVISPSY